MADADITARIVGFWGAVTGSIAVVVQIIQHFSDRPRLCAKASMSQHIDRAKPVARLRIDVEVSNQGRRPLIIEHVGIVMPNQKQLEPDMRHMRTYNTLFDAQSEGRFMRLDEKEKHIFRHDFFPQQWANALWNKGKTAQAFVRLTTGKEYFAKFYLIDPKNFP